MILCWRRTFRLRSALRLSAPSSSAAECAKDVSRGPFLVAQPAGGISRQARRAYIIMSPT